jgi:hypothetical protein
MDIYRLSAPFCPQSEMTSPKLSLLRAQVVVGFLSGESLRTILNIRGVTHDIIYTTLQQTFRLPVRANALGNECPEVQMLRSTIQLKDEALKAQTAELAEAIRSIEASDREILRLANDLEEAQNQIDALIERHMQSDAERNKVIDELTTANQDLRATVAQARENIKVLESVLDESDEASGGQIRRLEPTHPASAVAPVPRRRFHPQENQLWYLFYNGHDLSGLCAITGLAPDERHISVVIGSLVFLRMKSCPASAKWVSDNRVRLARLHGEFRAKQDAAAANLFDLTDIVSSASDVRANVFREMIQLARPPAEEGSMPRYSHNLYLMAVVRLFRSRSSYEFLRQFLPLPATSSIYGHFRASLKDSAARLKSIEHVTAYSDSRIAKYPEIVNGVALTVDAVSCADTFVGMKQIEEGEIGYLFVIYLQPLTPGVKCTPLFIIDSQSGMADDAIQAQIDQVLAIARSRISRVFIASDGDPSYNKRHHIFMEFWEAIYAQWGLERVVAELKTYDGIPPASDMLHLAKCFRTRFLKYPLTFTLGSFSESSSPSRMREILGLGAPLTDLTQVGKMRDAYPLVITRVEHINKLFQRGAIAEAVAWLPLSLCFNAIRLDNITRETRLFMLRISFFLVRILYESKESGLDTNSETSKKKKTTIFTSQWSVWFSDTVLLLIFSIENYASLAIDHLSTQALENFFGFVRMDSHDINTPKEMTNMIVHTDIVNEANRVLEIDQTVPGRSNLAGVHIDEQPPRGTVYDIAFADLLPSETIVSICLNAVHAAHDSLGPDEQVAFLQFRQYLTALQTAADHSCISNEINRRFIFGSESRIARLIISHGRAGADIGIIEES